MAPHRPAEHSSRASGGGCRSGVCARRSSPGSSDQGAEPPGRQPARRALCAPELQPSSRWRDRSGQLRRVGGRPHCCCCHQCLGSHPLLARRRSTLPTGCRSVTALASAATSRATLCASTPRGAARPGWHARSSRPPCCRPRRRARRRRPRWTRWRCGSTPRSSAARSRCRCISSRASTRRSRRRGGCSTRARRRSSLTSRTCARTATCPPSRCR